MTPYVVRSIYERTDIQQLNGAILQLFGVTAIAAYESQQLWEKQERLTGGKESRASLGLSLQFVPVFCCCSRLLTVSLLHFTTYSFTLCLKASSSVWKTSK